MRVERRWIFGPRVVAVLVLLVLLLECRQVRMAPLDDWLDELESDPRPESYGGGGHNMLLEATKRSWIAELAAKADWNDETADLMDHIQSRYSASGLKSLKAACKSMCPKCICGVILMPNLPMAKAKVKVKPPKKHASKHKELKKPKKKPTPKPKTKTTSKPKTKTTSKPKTKTTPKPETKTTSKPKTKTTAEVGTTEKPKVKKVKKKWLLDSIAESELPDFLLDEDADGDAFKREVGDHDPLSASRESLSYYGVE